MITFAIDPGTLAEDSQYAAKRAAKGEGPGLASRFRADEPIDDVDLATLLLSADVATDELWEIARASRPAGVPKVETFSPLYFTNECDGECKMCGMRRDNRALKRETVDAATICDQLDVLYRRGIRGVAVLAGEYRLGPQRDAMLARTAEAMRDAFERSTTASWPASREALTVSSHRRSPCARFRRPTTRASTPSSWARGRTIRAPTCSAGS